MIPQPFFYQLVVLGLLWLFVMLHYAWPNQGVTSPQKVTYLLAADKYCRPLASHLRGVNQPAIHTHNRFSASRPTSLACI